MSRPFLLIICGLPATGKTTLARRLAADMRLPVFCKDDLKETLFDTLGVGDRRWSQRLGVATFHLLRLLTTQMVEAGQSLIVEANLNAEYDQPVYQRLAERAEVLQIWMTASREVLAERFAQRAGAPDRHAGHVEVENLAEMRAALLTRHDAPLEIGGQILTVETSDFARVDYAAILQVALDMQRLAGAADGATIGDRGV